ncbi:PREDICTED: uncharacterized protein LOC105463024 isoform X2 [Wasmannia auropunctata]|uniref:uncharacterized protein LOC105463024 isoform X2 n=1 Tax=Wasmannia auropunctata TaxID=64793 RepID=UPI0005EEDC5A|nr:PREDICTED: uncharacterized protein LOC105463024 isoform X2 [Wasmannia auropunctata]
MFLELHKTYRFLHVPFRCLNVMSPLDLNKLKKRPLEASERPKKKVDRFDGLTEEEIAERYTLEDYLEMNLDIVFVGINPSLTAAHRGRYYAGPGNHFYKLLHESGLTPRAVSFEEDYKLLRHSIGLTNIVARPTRSAADLKRTELKEGAEVVREKLALYKPRIAVFNGKCIYEVFASITAKSVFHFGLQPERIGEHTAIWVTPSSSARCANFPRMVDKLHFYTALKKYLRHLKGEITDVDTKEFSFQTGRRVAHSTSKMWRRKNVSTFLHGGRVVNKNTLCPNASEEDIASIRTAEFLVEKSNREKYDKDEGTSVSEETYSREDVERQESVDETVGKAERSTKETEKLMDDVGDEMMIVNGSETKEISDINSEEEKSCAVVINDILSHENNADNLENNGCTSSKITRQTPGTENNADNLENNECTSSKITRKTPGTENNEYTSSKITRKTPGTENNEYTSSKISRKTPGTENNLINCNRSDTDFMSLIKQRLSQKNSSSDIVSTTSRSKSNSKRK